MKDLTKSLSGDKKTVVVGYVQAFRALNKVVRTSFGKKLLPGWEENIETFKEKYSKLKNWKGKPVSVTPKIHIIVEHVPQRCKLVGYGLGMDCEQASESSHAKFGAEITSQRIPGPKNPGHMEALCSSVCRWNAKRL